MVGFKNRYMVLEVNLNPNRDLGTDDPIILTNYNLTKAIRDSILVNFGECGLASSAGSLQGESLSNSIVEVSTYLGSGSVLAVKYVNHITKVCIIRASRQDYQNIWSAISLVKDIGNSPVLISLLDLTGSIKACRNAARKCEESKFEHYKLVAGASLSPQVSKQMQDCLDKIKFLEH